MIRVLLEWRTTIVCPAQRSPGAQRTAENLQPLSPCPASPSTERKAQISTYLFSLACVVCGRALGEPPSAKCPKGQSHEPEVHGRVRQKSRSTVAPTLAPIGCPTIRVDRPLRCSG